MAYVKKKKNEQETGERIDPMSVLYEDSIPLTDDLDPRKQEQQMDIGTYSKEVTIEDNGELTVKPMIPESQLDLSATTAPMPEIQHEDMFGRAMESDNQIKSVAKELFNQGQIELKTEVSHDEINNLTRLRFMRERFGIDNVETLTNSFLSLRVSKDRKSRSEFIAALQTENRNSTGGSVWSRLFGANQNNNQ